MYEKAHLILDFKKKKISSGGARTHENETRPEEICVHQAGVPGKCSLIGMIL